MKIHEIGALLKTQDNRITADPIFMVQERHRVYGMEPGYSENYAWFNEESDDWTLATEQQAEELDELLSDGVSTTIYCDDVDDAVSFDRVWYKDIWVNVQPFFTEAAAHGWIANNQHNYERPLRVYAESAHNNPEWKAIRKWLMEAAQ